MDEHQSNWVKKILGINGRDDEPRQDSRAPLQIVDKAIATSLIWCAAVLLILRFRNPELSFVLGAVAVGVTVLVWRKGR